MVVNEANEVMLTRNEDEEKLIDGFTRTKKMH